MMKTGPLPPEYCPPAHDNIGYVEAGGSYGAFPAPAGIMTAEQARDLTPPPAYDAVFYRREEPPPKPSKTRDYRNMWDKVHELFEDSLGQQLIWLAALVFAIFNIQKSIQYSGKCKKYEMKDRNQTVKEDLAAYLKTEGGVMCATILFVFLLRLWGLCDRRRTSRVRNGDQEGRNKCGGYLIFLCFGLFLANFALCMVGASKVFSFYGINATIVCDDTFYNYYHNAKIGQVVVFASYAAYIVLGLCVAVPISKKNFIRRKWRFFAYLLDADQDGIISQNDMKKTYAKLEVIRKTIGDRKTAVKEADQKKLWNDHIFKRGANKDISVEEYVLYLEGVYEPAGMANTLRPLITGLFDAFSTPEFRKKNTILAMEDFITFWKILADIDEKHCKKVFIKDFLNPLSMRSFLEEFVRFVSLEDFFNVDSLRVFLILKPSYEVDPCIDKLCRPSFCNV